MRLDKYLAQAHVGMRKEVREYIKTGAVMVNGQVAMKSEMLINEQKDIITYKGRRIPFSSKVYYMFYKPKGCITARKDELQPTILEYFSKIDTRGVFPVGRLDKDTEGLLFLTNDGEFDYHMMNPKEHVEKTYFFWAYGFFCEEKIKKIEAGVWIGKGEPITKPAKIKIVKAGTYKSLKDEMQDCPTPHVKEGIYEQPILAGYITITEGRKHQVKRMLKAVGCHIVYLKRISIGNVMLDQKLSKGQYRFLTEEELRNLMENNSEYPCCKNEYLCGKDNYI